MRQVPRARLALLFVVALVASGCMGGGEKQSANAPAKFGQKAVTPKFNSGVEEALDAHPVKASKEELGGWWLVSAHATPAGALTTFRWNVPFGAEIGLRARDTRGVYLEVAPVVVNGTGPEQWCLFGFVEAEGKLRFVPSPPAQVLGNNQIVFLPPATPAYCESAVTLTNRTVSTTPGSAAPSFVVQPTYRPFHISLETTKAIANVTYWVLAAKSAAPIEFGLAFRTFPELPGRTVQPAANVDVFLSNTGGQKPYAVKTNQVDAGFGFADYSGSTQVSTTAAEPGVVARDRRAGTSLKVTERLSVDPRPAVSIRDTTYEAGFDAARGWSYTWGTYYGVCGVGRWEATSALHGPAETLRGVTFQMDICVFAYGAFVRAATGTPGFARSGEGQGSAKSSFTIQHANAALEMVGFGYYGLGATLEELFGKPAAPVKLDGRGPAGNIPP